MNSNRDADNPHVKLLEQAITSVLERIEKEIELDPSYQLQPRDYLELNSLFGTVLSRSLEVLETCVIKHYLSDFVDHPGIIEVFGSTGKSYKFYTGINYCTCPSFTFDVIKHKSQYTCKHNLAARLAIILKRIQVVKTSRLKFKGLLKELQEQAEEKAL